MGFKWNGENKFFRKKRTVVRRLEADLANISLGKLNGELAAVINSLLELGCVGEEASIVRLEGILAIIKHMDGDEGI